jgi:hypothetical protein
MVCLVCRNMLGRQDGKFANGTHDILYNHHKSARAFQKAVEQDCYICRAVYVSLLDHLKNSVSQRRDSAVSSLPPIDERSILSGLAQRSYTSQASLFLEELDRRYRLVIRSKLDQISFQHTFHLECQRGSHEPPDRNSVHVKYQVRLSVRYVKTSRWRNSGSRCASATLRHWSPFTLRGLSASRISRHLWPPTTPQHPVAVGLK